MSIVENFWNLFLIFDYVFIRWFILLKMLWRWLTSIRRVTAVNYFTFFFACFGYGFTNTYSTAVVSIPAKAGYITCRKESEAMLSSDYDSVP